MECVEISAPAHLHAGNYELSCDENVSRCYGTIGVAVEKPRLVFRVCRSPTLNVYTLTGDKWCRELERYAREYATRIADLVGEEYAVELIRCYPWGAGLGARTPLALGIAEAARRLTAPEYSLEELALFLGRGWVSGLGFHAFTRGGLLVDAGFEPSRIGSGVPPLLYRSAPSVGIVAVLPLTPLGSIRRLKEEAEKLEKLLSVKAEKALSERLSRLVLVGFLGNLAAGYVREAFRALEEMNRVVGEYWVRHGQRGIYCCPEAEELMRVMKEEGAWGVFQSSWGPTVWGVYPDIREARRVAARLSRMRERIGDLLVWATSIDANGARVRGPKGD